jgi:hemin uptake protein HemP
MKNPNNTPLLNRQSDAIAQPVSSLAHRRVSSGELFGAQEEIVIEHNREEYRLRITKNDKLILTK